MNRIMKKNGKAATVLLALLVMALWGSLFPMIKIGYKAFQINTGDIPSIVLFAGLRFTFSGILLLCATVVGKRDTAKLAKSEIPMLLIGALATIILHYSFTYIGLALGEGSKSAIIKQIGFLFLACFAFVFDKTDRFSKRKAIAACLGFAGIIATAMDGTGISLQLGDLLLLLASACSAIGAVISKRATQRISPVKFVAYTQFIGGVFLLGAGILLGGRITALSPMSALLFLYICGASIGAYVLWNSLLKTGSISKLSIIKFTEPLFAVLFSGVLLGETIFKLSYLAALLLLLVALLVEHLPWRNHDDRNDL